MKILRKTVDFLTLPFRLLAPSGLVRALGLTSMLDERTDIVLKHCRGRVLDIGCGENLLIRKYRSLPLASKSIGIDIYDSGADLVVSDTAEIPMWGDSFDTITMIAVLNHIPASLRHKVLSEAYRLLKKRGRLILTCITPLAGKIRHNTIWWEPGYIAKYFSNGESYGLKENEVIDLANEAGFKLISIIPFTFSLNRMYIFAK